MTALPLGYSDIPEEDRKKAQTFFDRGRTVAETGNHEYAIEMYLQGLKFDPELIEAHQTLRDISLRRKATGGKPLGMFSRPSKGKDDRENMLVAEKLLAYDPGNTDHMVSMMQYAQKAGCYDTVMWIGAILRRANAESKKPDFNKYITLKDIYKSITAWKQAVDACHEARKLRPDSGDLSSELNHLSAMQTMQEGNYGEAKSFRESVRNMKGQQAQMEKDKDVRSMDSLLRAVEEAEAEYHQDPNDLAKLQKAVEALIRTEDPERENHAIELLDRAYAQSKQFKYRQRIGQIKLTQLGRLERTLRATLDMDDPKDLEEYRQFQRDRAKEELEIFREFVDNYPTDGGYRFEFGKRLFALSEFDQAIPIFQQVRSDPKFRNKAAMLLGQSFLSAGYVDEAVDTLRTLVDEYPNKGDDFSKEPIYWYGRALEQKGETAAALKCYSQVTQIDFKYKDVQARIKKLRTTTPAT